MNHYHEIMLQKIETLKQTITKEELQEQYNKLSWVDCIKYFREKYDCSGKILSVLLDYFNIERKGSGCILRKEHRDEIKAAMMAKYGVENAGQSPIIKEKIKQTNLERYGGTTPMASQEVRDKIKQTNLERYGTENVFQSEEIKNRIKETVLDRYGVDSVSKVKDIIDKSKQTKLERYGDSGYHNFKQMKKTNLEKYGYEMATKSQQVKDKTKQTNLDLYGVENVAQCKEIRDRARTKYTYDNMNFDSSWEIAFYIYHKDLGHDIKRELNCYDYLYNDEKHRYFADFTIDGVDYEIKSTYLLQYMTEQLDTIEHAKYLCMLEHNVKIISDSDMQTYLEYINNKYGKDYLTSLRNSKVVDN